jgi:hypothetical protein
MIPIVRICLTCSLVSLTATLPALAESSHPTNSKPHPSQPEVKPPQTVKVSQVEVKKVEPTEPTVTQPPVSTRIPLSSRIFSAPTMQQ